MRTAVRPAFGLLVIALSAACGDAAAPLEQPDPLTPQFAKAPQCRMNMRLLLVETGSLRADVANKRYIDTLEGVLVRSTGGLEFDTYTSNEIESASDLRRVRIDLSGTEHAAHASLSELNGINLTLGASDPNVNLCQMAVGQTVSRQATLTFVSSSTGVVKLAFGRNRGDRYAPITASFCMGRTHGSRSWGQPRTCGSSPARRPASTIIPGAPSCWTPTTPRVCNAVHPHTEVGRPS